MPEELRALLADPVVRRSVGEDAFRRGSVYANDGRVLDLELRPNGLEVGGDVAGSGGLLYHAFARYDRAADRWRGACSCPVAVDCKHVAATLVAARDSGLPAHDPYGTRAPVPAPQPTWERVLADLVREPGRPGARPFVPMGVQFQVEERPGRPASVRLQPVVPGARAKWVRTGVSWRNLPHERHTHRDPAHVAALLGLYEASRVRGQNHWYGNTAEPPVVLEEFGPGLWPALRRAVDDGVTLLTKRSEPVRLMPEPGELVVDVHDDGMGGLRLEPVVRMADDVRVPAGDLTLVGDPAHGAALVSGGGLVLTALEQVPRGVQKLLSARVVRVPAADRERFLSGFYPALRRALPVRSTSVELPEVRPPELCLRVEHEPGHRATLGWSVLYRTGDDVRRLPLARGTGVVPDTGRDAAAEDRLVRALPPPPERLTRLWRGHPHRPAPTAELQGIDAAVLTAEWLPRLAQAGVHVEQVGEPPDYRRSEAAPVITVSATDTADGDWFDLGVTVRVDGEEIPFVQVFAALALGEEFLLLPSGMWFDVRRPEFDRLRRLLDESRALQETDATDEPDLRISRYQAGLWEELVEVGVVDEQSERWERDVARLLEVEAAPPPSAPASLAAQLRPYQLEGYQWLSVLWDLGLGGVLADDMGLGKTLQTLALIARAHEAGELTAPVLVVAPTSVVSNWVREAERFAPGLRVVAVTGRKRGVSLASVVADADVVVTSYALLRLGEADYRELPWSGLVLDEAQFVKNHRAKTYAAARRVPARFKLAITGTPVENDLMDLWAMLSIVAPGLFPNPKLFSEHYRTPIERNRDAEVLAALRRRIRPLMRRRTKEQVAAELPPKQEQVLEVVLAPRHRKVYDTHLQAERRKVLGLVDDLQRNRFTIFRSLTLLRQLALDPALVDETYARVGIGSSKADAFLEHLREVVAEGHRALVFSSFTGFLRTVRSRLDAEGLPYAYLDGATRDRDAVVSSFRDGEAPVFLISLKAGGSGLNLTEADYVFVLDPWWNPAAEAQAVDRAHRIGQDKTVMVYRLVAADTIEEKVLALQERKRDLFARVMEDDDGALTGPLTAEDIRGLFA